VSDERQERRCCPLTHRDERPRYSWEAAGTVLCGGHVRGCDNQLAELPKLYELLSKAHLSSGVAIGYGSRSAETPLIIKSKVTEHRGRIIGALAFFTATVAGQRGLSDPARYEVADMARFLRRHLDWILRQDNEDLAADDFASQISDLHYDARQLIWPDRQQTRTRISCPVDGCEGTLRPMSDKDTKDDDLLPVGLICGTCGVVLPPGEWRKLARDVHQMSGLVTEQDVLLWAEVSGYRITGPTIRQWATRGHIGRFDRDGRTLYDLDEIEARIATRKTDAA
jgi:hypothetical protein